MSIQPKFAGIALAMVLGAGAQAGVIGGSGSLGGGLGTPGGRSLSGNGASGAQGQFDGLAARDRVGALKNRTGDTLEAARAGTTDARDTAKGKATDARQTATTDAAAAKARSGALATAGAIGAAGTVGATRDQAATGAAGTLSGALAAGGTAPRTASKSSAAATGTGTDHGQTLANAGDLPGRVHSAPPSPAPSAAADAGAPPKPAQSLALRSDSGVTSGSQALGGDGSVAAQHSPGSEGAQTEGSVAYH